ncbi:ankyrin repeat protein [Piedraia hortae CBS 480.64]|uniref:Ankyrin repeat protein n=1 Tax=Piedraia hortae CBS 480.64 TaxID=1314780 RepID=A0A6A7C945_9PEZI|nr:ankyrin repeat protein [Piedraia hortae CBS 480.64]
MKFGKHIQKRQLEIPEYAPGFIDYKGLKKLIKQCVSTQAPLLLSPAIPTASQANKQLFFAKIDSELERINTFYLRRQGELTQRLATLLDQKDTLISQSCGISKLTSDHATLEEGFRFFNSDLDKLQQFVEVNRTAFSKIMKKWDKLSKSRSKELFLARAVDVQPCFNPEVISELSDKAQNGQLELQAWAEGETVTYTSTSGGHSVTPEDAVEGQLLRAIGAGEENVVRRWATYVAQHDNAKERISRMFQRSMAVSSPEMQLVLDDTGMVDYNYIDRVTERNCVHEAAISGNVASLDVVIAKGANVRARDAYGRLPLHYACMDEFVEIIQKLVAAAPDSVDTKDNNAFTPLIHGIIGSKTDSVKLMLKLGARITDNVPLNLACQHATQSIVELILQHLPAKQPNAEKLYPQHIAARFGRGKQVFSVLKKYGANLNQPDNLYAWSPLFYAANEGHLDSLRALLELQVDVDVIDEKGHTAMYYAAWEGHLNCMLLLATYAKDHQVEGPENNAPPILGSRTPTSIGIENIPTLSLPPPMIPVRHYGQHFLDKTKTFVLLSFDVPGREPIEFYGESRCPAARLTVTSKLSSLLPRSISLPLQDGSNHVYFLVQDLRSFSIDLDIYPGFGSKIIARAAASSRIFTGNSGFYECELFDLRMRAVGSIAFRYQVVKPVESRSLEMPSYRRSSQPGGSEAETRLSGDYLRLFVQVSSDGIPVVYPYLSIPRSRNDLISRLTFQDLSDLTATSTLSLPTDLHDVVGIQKSLAEACWSLAQALELLAADMQLEVHICRPNASEAEESHMSQVQDVNTTMDAVLKVIFSHSQSRMINAAAASPKNVIFTSYDAEVCIALNWKQSIHPVFLCNAFCPSEKHDSSSTTKLPCGVTSRSVKETVRIAEENYLAGIICEEKLLNLVPGLVKEVQASGLLVLKNCSKTSGEKNGNHSGTKVDGTVERNAVVRFFGIS